MAKEVEGKPIIQAEKKVSKDPIIQEEPKFNKEQILKSKKYRESIDLIGALLDDRKEYSLREVDEQIKQFKKREVKIC